MNKYFFTQGFMLLDLDVSSLNNAGKSTASNLENGVETKKVFKDGKPWGYISGQASGNWWRLTLQRELGWDLSPMQQDGKVVYTAADPIKYPDDDVFGFMRAAKELKFKEDGSPDNDARGNQKKEDATVTRKSPFNRSVITSVAPVSIARGFSSMSRHQGNSVPYQKEEYSAVMRQMFSINIWQVGTFSTFERAGYRNLTTAAFNAAMESGMETINDPFNYGLDGKPALLVRLPKQERIRRITDTIGALQVLSGGAMQTDNMADVTPKFIILVTTTSGNHPFGHIAGEALKEEVTDAEEGDTAEEEDRPRKKFLPNATALNIAALKEVLTDYKKRWAGDIYIGLRKGFLPKQEKDIYALAELDTDKYPKVHVAPVNETIDAYCQSLKQFMHDTEGL